MERGRLLRQPPPKNRGTLPTFSTCAAALQKRRPSTRQGRSPMRRHGTTLVSVFIFVGAVQIAACAKPYHEENERYVVVATNINLPNWQEAEAGCLEAARALGGKGGTVCPRGCTPQLGIG